MSGKQISVIYFYLISVASVALMVVGFFSIVNLVINLTQYDEYPLRYEQVGNCDIYPVKERVPVAVDTQTPATMSDDEKMMQRNRCIKQTELDRKKHKLDDMRNAITFPFIGILLFAIHFPQARKQSRDK